ncbi:MAG: hypothetical protein BRC39_00835 [Cyanobacteria bacterium QH_7_48_89]|nr:MAG: hypothetical protein BRC39_00835 [Cyanobacteria bacterium QH_7_48_89]
MTNAEKKWEEAALNNLTSNGERIAVVENKLDAVQADVSELKQSISGLDTRVSGLETSVSSIDTRLSSVESSLRWVRWIGAGILTVLSMIGIGLLTNSIWAYAF